MKFKFYVLNYNFNKRTTEMFNIFGNIHVQEESEKAIRKYLRAPRNFSKESFWGKPTLYGWEAFVAEIDSIIRWQEAGRCEYECSANEKFVPEVADILKDIDKFESLDEFKKELEVLDKRTSRSKSWDCYQQAHANIETICHDIIRQYKCQIKESKI